MPAKRQPGLGLLLIGLAILATCGERSLPLALLGLVILALGVARTGALRHRVTLLDLPDPPAEATPAATPAAHPAREVTA